MTYSKNLFFLLNSQIMIRRHLNTNIFSTPCFRLLDTLTGDLGSKVRVKLKGLGNHGHVGELIFYNNL
jgi:hypothetical protein